VGTTENASTDFQGWKMQVQIFQNVQWPTVFRG